MRTWHLSELPCSSLISVLPRVRLHHSFIFQAILRGKFGKWSMNLWYLRNPDATDNLAVSSDPKTVWKIFKEMEGISSMFPEDSLNIMLQVKL